MPKVTSSFICQQCGFKTSQYFGKCPQCDSWNSMVETLEDQRPTPSTSYARSAIDVSAIKYLNDVKNAPAKRLDTNFEEFNRSLGGGIVVGSLSLMAGDPGIGKSTLLTQIALNIPNSLYIAGEESAEQIKLRADRIKKNAKLAVLNEIDVDVITAVIEKVRPPLVIIDSIQTMQTQDLSSMTGSISQVRETALRLQRAAKSLNVPIFLVGHVTKEGTLAGPMTLEHLVDVVLSLEGDPISQFRILRSSKNRFGPTDEVGIFEMKDVGMIEVSNPSKIFLDQRVQAPGSAVIGIMTGQRPLLLEIQALATQSSLPNPRRTAVGLDNNRLQLLVAVLQKRFHLPLFNQDVFVNVTGGLRVFEPAADLGICMAIISSFKDLQIRGKTAFIGEVGLLGEIREVRFLEKRVKEAKKLGFTNIISAQNAKSLAQAAKLAFMDKNVDK